MTGGKWLGELQEMLEEFEIDIFIIGRHNNLGALYNGIVWI
jgi:hypothetical protein